VNARLLSVCYTGSNCPFRANVPAQCAMKSQCNYLSLLELPLRVIQDSIILGKCFMTLFLVECRTILPRFIPVISASRRVRYGRSPEKCTKRAEFGHTCVIPTLNQRSFVGADTGFLVACHQTFSKDRLRSFPSRPVSPELTRITRKTERGVR
jgi:hypothetical protein